MLFVLLFNYCICYHSRLGCFTFFGPRLCAMGAATLVSSGVEAVLKDVAGFVTFVLLGRSRRLLRNATPCSAVW